MSVRSLNPNRKTHRERFAKKCEDVLDILNMQNKLNKVSVNFNRRKMEHVDEDMTYVLRKARKDGEELTIKMEKSVEKRKLRALITHWKSIILEKDGKNVSKVIMQKLVHVAEARGKQDYIKLEAKEKLREVNENYKEHVKKQEKERRRNVRHEG